MHVLFTSSSYRFASLRDLQCSPLADDFYSQQPYFTPFQCYEDEIINTLPEPVML